MFRLIHVATNRFEKNYGTAVLAEYLNANGVECSQKIINMDFNSLILRGIQKINRSMLDKINFRYIKNGKHPLLKQIDEQIVKLKLKSNDVVGFSIISNQNLFSSLAMAKRIKEKLGNEIIFGGPYVKLFSHTLDYNFIDHLVGGGAEEVLKTISGTLKVPEDYPGINQLRAHNKSRQHSNIYYQLTKGCHFNCSFCSYNKIDKVSFKKISMIVGDLKRLHLKYGSKFRFVDSNINMDTDYLHSVCRAIISNKLEINWASFAYANINTDLELLKEAGCRELILGFESASPRILKILNKPYEQRVQEEFLRDCKKAGIEASVTLMVGVPGEKMSDIQKTVEFINRNRDYFSRITMHSFRLIHGTPMFNNPSLYGIRNMRKYSVINPDIYKYDEEISWKDICKRTRKHSKVILNAIKKNRIEHYSLNRD